AVPPRRWCRPWAAPRPADIACRRRCRCTSAWGPFRTFYVALCRSWTRTIADLSVSASPIRPFVEPAVATGSKTRIGLADALPGPANNRDFCRQAANANDDTVHEPGRLLGDRFNPCPWNEQWRTARPKREEERQQEPFGADGDEQAASVVDRKPSRG